jgi:uncharacterized protein (TIGR02147 family)
LEIFNCHTHTEFLENLFNDKKAERGLLSRISEALGVHPSYLSRAIKGENNLTPDQGFALGQWLGLEELEKEYLLTLIQRDRAASYKFKENLKAKLDSIRERKNDLGRDFKSQVVPNQAEATYYTSWLYSAIHILMTINEYNSIAKMAKALRVNEVEIETGLKILEEMGLAQQKNSKWILTNKKVFISNSNALAQCYHSNWSDRLNSILSVYDSKNIRYTGVHSVSHDDWEKLKQMIRDFLRSLNPVIEPSKEETLIAIRIDAGKVI